MENLSFLIELWQFKHWKYIENLQKQQDLHQSTSTRHIHLGTKFRLRKYRKATYKGKKRHHNGNLSQNSHTPRENNNSPPAGVSQRFGIDILPLKGTNIRTCVATTTNESNTTTSINAETLAQEIQASRQLQLQQRSLEEGIEFRKQETIEIIVSKDSPALTPQVETPVQLHVQIESLGLTETPPQTHATMISIATPSHSNIIEEENDGINGINGIGGSNSMDSVNSVNIINSVNSGKQLQSEIMEKSVNNNDNSINSLNINVNVNNNNNNNGGGSRATSQSPPPLVLSPMNGPSLDIPHMSGQVYSTSASYDSDKYTELNMNSNFSDETANSSTAATSEQNSDHDGDGGDSESELVHLPSDRGDRGDRSDRPGTPDTPSFVPSLQKQASLRSKHSRMRNISVCCAILSKLPWFSMPFGDGMNKYSENDYFFAAYLFNKYILTSGCDSLNISGMCRNEIEFKLKKIHNYRVKSNHIQTHKLMDDITPKFSSVQNFEDTVDISSIKIIENKQDFKDALKTVFDSAVRNSTTLFFVF